MSQITTHVLDTALGKPGVGIPVNLEIETGENWVKVGGGVTNEDGRVPELMLAGHEITAGCYRITFESQVYFDSQKRKTFYPYAQIVFNIEEVSQHHHVPLLISGYGYSTYRGS
jgi:5-hydroxyisourate hydrolase